MSEPGTQASVEDADGDSNTRRVIDARLRTDLQRNSVAKKTHRGRKSKTERHRLSARGVPPAPATAAVAKPFAHGTHRLLCPASTVFEEVNKIELVEAGEGRPGSMRT